MCIRDRHCALPAKPSTLTLSFTGVAASKVASVGKAKFEAALAKDMARLINGVNADELKLSRAKAAQAAVASGTATQEDKEAASAAVQKAAESVGADKSKSAGQPADPVHPDQVSIWKVREEAVTPPGGQAGGPKTLRLLVQLQVALSLIHI